MMHLQKSNPNHDERGRFANSGSAIYHIDGDAAIYHAGTVLYHGTTAASARKIKAFGAKTGGLSGQFYLTGERDKALRWAKENRGTGKDTQVLKYTLPNDIRLRLVRSPADGKKLLHEVAENADMQDGENYFGRRQRYLRAQGYDGVLDLSDKRFSPQVILFDADAAGPVKKSLDDLVVLEVILKKSELGAPLDRAAIRPGRFYSVQTTPCGDVVKVHEVGKNVHLRLSAITVRPVSVPISKSVDISDAALVEDLAKAAEWREELHPRGEHGKFASASAAVEPQKMPPQLTGMTKEEFETGFSVPHHPDLAVRIDKFIPHIMDNQPALVVAGDIYNRNTSEQVGRLHRVLGLDREGNLACHNMSLDIHPGWQGTGIGTDFYNQSEKFCQEIGVKYIELQANAKVGSLAWPLNGYDFANPDAQREVRGWFESMLDAHHSIERMGDAEFEESNQRLAGIHHAWEFATFATPSFPKFGREVLLFRGPNGGYEARKDLSPDSLGWKIGQAYQKLKLERMAAHAQV